MDEKEKGIEIQNLTKTYGDKTVLEQINMVFEKGKITGLIGRNGSGKTLLLKALCGLIRPDSGNILWDGKKVENLTECGAAIGVIIETPGFLTGYSGYKNLQFLAMIKNNIGKAEIKEALHMVGLDDTEKKPVGKYSLGMKQRLGIAQAIMENPDILLLDEPMNGLDNQGVGEMQSLFLSLKERGKTIVLASHSKADVDLLCDRVYKLDYGKVVCKENIDTRVYTC